MLLSARAVDAISLTLSASSDTTSRPLTSVPAHNRGQNAAAVKGFVIHTANTGLAGVAALRTSVRLGRGTAVHALPDEIPKLVITTV